MSKIGKISIAIPDKVKVAQVELALTSMVP